MFKSCFRIDLGQGDFLDVDIEREREYTLDALLIDVNKAKQWIVFGDAAIQKTHIKRIVELKK